MPEKLKKGWTRVAFGDVVRQVKYRVNPEVSNLERYVAGEHMDTDDLKIRRWGLIGDGYLGPAFHMRFKPGHVLYGSRRTYLRKVAVADFEGITANTTYVIESKDPKVLLPELLPFIMQTESFHDHSIKQSKGSVNPYINFSDLTWYEFALPPLEEQRRIAEVLETCEAAVESTRRVLDAGRAAELSLFWELTKRSNARPVALGSVLDEGPRNGFSATESGQPTGHWVLALSAITRWGYRRGELKPVLKSDAMAAAVIKKGDLVISRSNTRELVGLPAVFDEDRTDVSWPDTMMRLRPDQSRLRTVFLELFLRCPSGRSQVQSFAAGTSASMKKINGTNVKKIQIPLPQLAVQDAIEAKTRAFLTARGSVQRRMDDMSQIRRRLLLEVLGNRLAEGT